MIKPNDLKIVEISAFTQGEFKKLIAQVQCERHSQLTIYLKQFAYGHSKKNFYKTYGLINSQNNLIAYISFSLATIDNSETLQNKANIPSSLNYPIPALKITRLLVSDNFTRQGIGTDLMILADILALIIAFQAGCKFLLVDAKQDAEIFYSNNDFKILKENDDDTILMFKSVDDIDVNLEKYIKFCADYSLKSFKTYLKHL